jgi:hypothetical protein
VSDPWARRPDIDSLPDSPLHSDHPVDISYLYPILQKLFDSPVDPAANDEPTTGKPKPKKKKSAFVPWSQSPAIIKFSFHGDNPLSTFLDNAWGSVQIPLRELVDQEYRNDEVEDVPGVQREVRVWREIMWTSAHLQVKMEERSSPSHNLSQRLQSAQEEELNYVENIGDLDNPYHAIFAPRDNTNKGSKAKTPTTPMAQVLLRLQLDVRFVYPLPSP